MTRMPNATGRVVILMGSPSDRDHVQAIVGALETLGVVHTERVASAHKSVRHLLAILDEYAGSEGPVVFIGVAGRSNALAGTVDANTPWPVITCPPASTAYGGADIFSSLRMPSGVAPGVILEPANAALAAAKILALADPALRARIGAYQREMTETIEQADERLARE